MGAVHRRAIRDIRRPDHPASVCGRLNQGLDIGEFSRQRIDASAAELVSERDAVAELGLI